MNVQLAMVPLREIHFSSEDYRDDYSKAGFAKLVESVRDEGILVPVVLRELGGRYDLVDGRRRVEALNALSLSSGSNPDVPAAIVSMPDDEALAAQVYLNEFREQMSSLAKALATLDLLDKSWSQDAIGKKLGRTQSWVSKVGALRDLREKSARVLDDVRSGEIHLSHGLVLAEFAKRPDVVDFLAKEAKGGDASTSALRELGKRASDMGVKQAGKARPRMTTMEGTSSRVHVAPQRDGTKLTMFVPDGDDLDAVTKALAGVIQRVRDSKKPRGRSGRGASS